MIMMGISVVHKG